MADQIKIRVVVDEWKVKKTHSEERDFDRAEWDEMTQKDRDAEAVEYMESLDVTPEECLCYWELVDSL